MTEHANDILRQIRESDERMANATGASYPDIQPPAPPPLDGTADNPETILPSTFETEAAQTDTWDRGDQDSGEDGVSVRLQTRTAYDDTSDEKLYAYYRTFVFDSNGVLKTISAETRVTVDTPEDCDT